MLIIIKERDGPYDYYHIATAIGGYGIIESVDGKFRAEHYDESVRGVSVTDDMWQSADLFHLGNTDTFEEALQLITAALELPPYISGKGKNNDDWLCKYVRQMHLPEDVDTVLHTWFMKMDAVPWAGHANESRREAEFFETHTAEDPHGLRASECYARADALDFMHNTRIDSFREEGATVGHTSVCNHGIPKDQACITCVQVGGCWYCGQDGKYLPLQVCFEFDTNIHLKCVKERAADPAFTDDPELEVIIGEFKNRKLM